MCMYMYTYTYIYIHTCIGSFKSMIAKRIIHVACQVHPHLGFHGVHQEAELQEGHQSQNHRGTQRMRMGIQEDQPAISMSC